jgi:hypothetical protein
MRHATLWQGRPLQYVFDMSIFPNPHDLGDNRPPPQLLPLKIGLPDWKKWEGGPVFSIIQGIGTAAQDR